MELQTRFNCNTILLNYINLSRSSLFFSHLLQKRSGFSINHHILSMHINSYYFHTESCMKYINVFLKHVGLNRFSHMRQVLRNLTLIAATRTQAIGVPQLLLPLPHPIHNHRLLSRTACVSHSKYLAGISARTADPDRGLSWCFSFTHVFVETAS
jgi:hypothetical protein